MARPCEVGSIIGKGEFKNGIRRFLIYCEWTYYAILHNVGHMWQSGLKLKSKPVLSRKEKLRDEDFLSSRQNILKICLIINFSWLHFVL